MNHIGIGPSTLDMPSTCGACQRLSLSLSLSLCRAIPHVTPHASCPSRAAVTSSVCLDGTCTPSARHPSAPHPFRSGPTLTTPVSRESRNPTETSYTAITQPSYE